MAYQPNNANGQAAMANSAPVVVASDQSNLPANVKQLNSTTIDTNSGNKSAGTQRVILATDQPTLSNPIPVSDNGGSLTVDGSVTADTELTTADLDTGAGTDTRAVVGIAGAASGGAVLVQATAAGAMKHDLTTIAATAVDVNAGNVSAGTQRVVVATDQATLPVRPQDQTATGSITTQNLVPAGTATANSAVTLTALMGVSAISVQVTGTYTGALSVQGTIDGTTWVTLGGIPFLNVNTGASSATIVSAAQSIYQVEVAGFKQVRITGLAAMTGTAVVSIQSTNGAGLVALAAPLPTGANTIGVISTVSQLTGGAVAHGSADSGNPLKTGGMARTTNPAAIADAQRSNFVTDKLGKQVTVNSIRDLKADAALTLTASTTETTLITQIASTFNDLYGLIVTNTSATACEVVFRDTTGGTARFSVEVPPTETRGFAFTESAAYKQTTVNTNWTAQCGTSVSSIKISALYVKNI